jgi:hypothetical protein
VKRINIYLIILIFILPAFACSAKKKMSGVMVYGHEARTVKICGQTNVYWIHADKALQQQLRGQAQKLSNEPYGELYIEFSGVFSNSIKGEFAREYDGTIELQKVHVITAGIPANCNELKPSTHE